MIWMNTPRASEPMTHRHMKAAQPQVSSSLKRITPTATQARKDYGVAVTFYCGTAINN